MTGTVDSGVELSPQQRRLWKLTRGEDRMPRVRCRLRDVGPVQEAGLTAVLAKLVARHEILRTSFRRLSGMSLPVQVIGASVPVEPELLTATSDAVDETAAAWFRRNTEAPFHALSATPLRVALVTAGERRDVLLDLPAIYGDLRSIRILAAELGRLLAGKTEDEPPLEPLPYADVSSWLNDLQEVEEAAEGRELWAGIEAELEQASLPLAGAEVGAGAAVVDSVPVAWDREDLEALEGVARRAGGDLEDVLLVLWITALERLTGGGAATAALCAEGRDYPELEAVVGPLARLLPLPAESAATTPFLQAVAAGAERRREALVWQECFDPSLVVQDVAIPPWPSRVEVTPGGSVAWGSGEATVDMERADLEPPALKLTVSRDGGAEVVFDPRSHPRAAAEDLARRLALLAAGAVGDPGTRLVDLPLMDDAELHRWRSRSAGAAPATAEEGGVVERFAARAAAHPDRPALTWLEQDLTYGELADRAAAVARQLASRGVGPDDVVALVADRSAASVVAIFGILAAGAAYAPLEPRQPPRRLGRMLAACAPVAILTDATGAAVLDGVELPSPAPFRQSIPDVGSGELAPRPTQPSHLAYVIFTSGSTGRPKAVGVERRNLLAYVDAAMRQLGLDGEATFAHVSTLAADLGHTSLFPPLLGGGRLLLVDEAAMSSPLNLARTFARCPPDYLKIVPGHLRALLSGDGGEELLPRRALVLGGEACPPDLVARLGEIAPELPVFNHYGPTETTVGALTHPVPRGGAADGARVQVGHPLPGYRAYVTDSRMRALPDGVAGELLVGGAGVARGYLGRPAATAERFCPDPFGEVPGARVYRTGDRVRRLPGGGVDFLGRTDHQVKLRGFRIELGEIEHSILASGDVSEAAVVVDDGDGPGARLVAYLVAAGGRQADPEAERRRLNALLPEHMMPAAWVVLDRLPRTANGKLDRAALPRPEAASAPATPPRTAVERLLVEVWQEVLGRSSVGIHDNFFGLGGDSILGIQVVAKVGARGRRMTPLDLFRHQTVAELAVVLEEAGEVRAEQGPVAGPLPLTPVQTAFFETSPADPSRWNQSLLFLLEEQLGVAPMRSAVARLLAHHDALRSRFRLTSTGVEARIDPPADPPATPFTVIDLELLPEDRLSGAIEAAVQRTQETLNLEQGPLLRVVQLATGRARPDRLLITAHHLVVDGVSWRILLADLAAVARDLQAGHGGALPPKTTSYRTWAEHLAERAADPATAVEESYWRGALEAVPPLPANRPAGEPREGAQRSLSRRLEAGETDLLLSILPERWGRRLHDALLAAVAWAVHRWTGRDRVLVDVEGHGREGAGEDVDLSRTVGWFTAIHPLAIPVPEEDDPIAGLEEAARAVRDVPAGGLGYGLLRHLSPDPALRRRLSDLPRPELRCNYLGRFDLGMDDGGSFASAPEKVRGERAPGGPRPYPLDVLASVVDGRLGISWIYSPERYDETTVAALADDCVAALGRLAEACRGTAAEPTAQTTGADLSAGDMERLMAQIGEAG